MDNMKNELAEIVAEFEQAGNKWTNDLYDRFNSIVDKYLTNEYPEFYSNVRCGIGVPPGWLQIVVDLSFEIKTLLEQHPGVELIVDQIKEKFGTLRFYCHTKGADKILNVQIHDLVQVAMDKSASTCFYCGEPGTLDTHTGWHNTTCEKHKHKN